MALALLFDELLRTGQVASMADLAATCSVTRARMSQVLALLDLAPTIQQRLLTPPISAAARESITERSLRPLHEAQWAAQVESWEQTIGDR